MTWLVDLAIALGSATVAVFGLCLILSCRQREDAWKEISR